MKIIMSQRKEELERALKAHRSTVTVEAEYGNSVIEGTILTMAHHGPRADNPAPCLAWHQAGEVSYPGLRGKTDITSVEVVGVSHIDLDTLGGIAAILGRSSKTRKNYLTASFWLPRQKSTCVVYTICNLYYRVQCFLPFMRLRHRARWPTSWGLRKRSLIP